MLDEHYSHPLRGWGYDGNGLTFLGPCVLRFSSLTITVHVTDYHWDRHLYFVITSYHTQTMTHHYDSLLVHILVVSDP
jgi:hypothetical protein